jgi:acetyl-CoA carboxylase biotin carboxyl carrier protein
LPTFDALRGISQGYENPRIVLNQTLRLIDGSDFTELTLEMGDLKLELRKGGAAPAADAFPVAVPAAPVPVAAKVVASGGGSVVPAPLLGTFRHAPRPGAEAFVKPGDVATADTVIGIIEVMKLVNSITAGVAGTLLEIVALNGELVEHGQPLIRIQPV